MKQLSEKLTKELGRGFSYDNLKLMRKFYMVYSKDLIRETAFPQSEQLPTTKEGRNKNCLKTSFIVCKKIRAERGGQDKCE